MFDPRLRYQGSAPMTGAVLGDPRVFGMVVFIALAFGVGVAVALALGFDPSHLGHLALLGGPVAAASSVDLREQAAAKWQEVASLEAEDGTIATEDQPKYDALMDEAMKLDEAYANASAAEGKRTTVRERLEYYHGKATGQQLRFAATELDPRSAMSLGEQFVNSESYKKLQARGAFNSRDMSIQTEPVTLFTPQGRMRAAASDVISIEGGRIAQGVPQRLPGVYGWGAPPLNVRSLFPNESTSADVIEYVQQTARDTQSPLTVKESSNATDAAGLKKQSSIGWEVQNAPAEIIATWFAATRRSLGNPDGVRSFIDNQGRLLIAIEEEDQLINGDGTRPNLKGLLSQSGILALDISALGGMDNLDALRRAKRLVKTGLSRLPATFVILNPADSEGYDLLKNGIDDYRGGNPIGGAPGDGELPIWRLRRVESEAVDEGTAIVGSGAAATVFERNPLTVYTADQHSDFFVRNLVVILFEETLAFPVYFPTAICKVSLEDFQVGS